MKRFESDSLEDNHYIEDPKFDDGIYPGFERIGNNHTNEDVAVATRTEVQWDADSFSNRVAAGMDPIIAICMEFPLAHRFVVAFQSSETFKDFEAAVRKIHRSWRYVGYDDYDGMETKNRPFRFHQQPSPKD